MEGLLKVEKGQRDSVTSKETSESSKSGLMETLSGIPAPHKCFLSQNPLSSPFGASVEMITCRPERQTCVPEAHTGLLPRSPGCRSGICCCIQGFGGIGGSSHLSDSQALHLSKEGITLEYYFTRSFSFFFFFTRSFSKTAA